MANLQNQLLDILIIDDELDACELMKLHLQAYPHQVQVVPMFAHNAKQALALIELYTPQILIVDIHMPNQNGIDFVTNLGEHPFDIIFATAYDEYAVKAIKLNAIDYLLKPVIPEELDACLQKLFKKHNTIGPANANINNAFDQEIALRNVIVLKDNHEKYIIHFDDLICLEAKGSYTKVSFSHLGNAKSIVVSHSIGYFLDVLPNVLFFRSHKSFVINKKHFIKLNTADQLKIELNFKQSALLSRRRYADFIRFIS
jgi:two-component system, LytTR family, response regulator